VELLGIEPVSKRPVSFEKLNLTTRNNAKLPANTRKVLTGRVRWHGHVGFGAGQSARTLTAMVWPSSSIQVAPSPVAGLSTAQTAVVHWAPGRRAAGPAATPRPGI